MQYIFKMSKEEKRQVKKQENSASEAPAADVSEDKPALIPATENESAAAGSFQAETPEPAAAELQLSTEIVNDSEPSGGQDAAAITDWHWHSSKWEARAARTTLNEQGGYDGSKDHPGYGTEPGPEFRCVATATCYCREQHKCIDTCATKT